MPEPRQNFGIVLPSLNTAAVYKLQHFKSAKTSLIHMLSLLGTQVLEVLQLVNFVHQISDDGKTVQTNLPAHCRGTAHQPL